MLHSRQEEVDGIDASVSESAADEDTTEESVSYAGGNLAAVIPWFRSDRDEGANDEAGRPPQLTFSFPSPSAGQSMNNKDDDRSKHLKKPSG